ncbi:iron-containing redox enzyme family protein [Sorangium sp. So ce1099]|uniref:iron-containing redox enzyme family protein n=1 Tax=Sorangium sp. So ce1099 TaxID=3133331 RepID=UPI003F642D08
MLDTNEPRTLARRLLATMAPDEVRDANQAFVDALLDEIRSHPFTRNPALAALRAGAFDRGAVRDIHLDFLGIVRVFTDVILMAQFHTRKLEGRLGVLGKMVPRFLLALNVLDELGFAPGDAGGSGYRGTPRSSHAALFDAVLCELGADERFQASFQPSHEATALRAFFESTFDDLLGSLAAIAVTEEEALRYSAPMRAAARAAGVPVDAGYYIAHGSSDDGSLRAADDQHQSDVLHILVHCMEPADRARLREASLMCCDAWDRFWHRQMERLPGGRSPRGA